MLRAIVLSLLAFALPAAAQTTFSGTYTTKNPAGQTVTLSLKQDAQGKVTGTLSGADATFNVQAQVQQGALVGTVTGAGGMLYLLAQLQGNQITVGLAEPTASGQPNMQRAQQLVMTRTGAAAPPAAASKAPAAAAAAGGKPTDEQATQFLSANAWCSFTYNQRSGASSTERVVFGADGWVGRRSGSETYSSGSAGTVAGQYGSSDRARWRVRNLQLELSQDGVNWAPQTLDVTRNSNGSPIIKSGGKEYMVCR